MAAERLAAQLVLGGDPSADKRAAREQAADQIKVKPVMDAYLARPQGKRRDRTMVAIRRHLMKNLAALHGLSIKALTRRDVAGALNKVAEKSGITQANRTRTSLCSLLTWALREGHVENNVAMNTNRFDEVARDRVLDDSELRKVWLALEDDDFSDIVRLLILTGARREEVAQLTWREIDLDQAIITLPAARVKNGRKHILPLSRLAHRHTGAAQDRGHRRARIQHHFQRRPEG